MRAFQPAGCSQEETAAGNVTGMEKEENVLDLNDFQLFYGRPTWTPEIHLNVHLVLDYDCSYILA